jgi:hypothetical protein
LCPQGDFIFWVRRRQAADYLNQALLRNAALCAEFRSHPQHR